MESGRILLRAACANKANYNGGMKSLLANLLATALALTATLVDLRLGDVALLMMMAMAFPLLLALLWPRQFWMWALVIAVPLPVALSAKRFIFHEGFAPSYLAAWIALLPAMVGATAGWAFRRIIRSLREDGSKPAGDIK